jgi:hypothetical protein
MDWYWYPLIALGALLAMYAVVAAVILAGRRGAMIEMPGGETIEVPREPPPPRKSRRLTIDWR